VVDTLTKAQRSKRMSLIKSKNSQAELAVRKLIFGAGYRYRLHDTKLPGRPDLVFASRKRVIFVHGCFWHQHGCRRYKQPTTRTEFWNKKLGSNVTRDRAVRRTIARLGWRSLVVWECELRNPGRVLRRAMRFLG
jgi:DNA mismatch endonuclease, patch repair protein